MRAVQAEPCGAGAHRGFAVTVAALRADAQTVQGVCVDCWGVKDTDVATNLGPPPRTEPLLGIGSDLKTSSASGRSSRWSRSRYCSPRSSWRCSSAFAEHVLTSPRSGSFR